MASTIHPGPYGLEREGNELGSLMVRGLDEETAINVIIRGMLQ